MFLLLHAAETGLWIMWAASGLIATLTLHSPLLGIGGGGVEVEVWFFGGG